AISNSIGFGTMRGCVLEKTDEGGDEVVPMSRLDFVIRSHGLDGLDLIKVDVEGHEPEVLEGMGPFLAESKPTLLIEVLSDSAGEKLEALLGPLEYLYFDLDEIGPPRKRPHIRKSSHWNYLVAQPAVAETLALQ